MSTETTAMRDRSVGLAFVFLGAALFGTLGVFGRAAALIELSAATLLGLRFVAATAILAGVLVLSGRFERLTGRVLRIELLLGLVYGIMSITYFESLVWLSAGFAALVLFTYPVQVTIVSSLTLSEPITLPKLLSLLAAIAGVALVMGGEPIAIHPLGVTLVVIASVCYTIYAIGTRVMVRDIDPLVHSTYVFVGVTVTILAYGLVTGTLGLPGSIEGWSLVVGITLVGTLLPMVLFSAGLVRVPASTASIVSTSEPLTTVLLGVILLGEVLTPTIAVGALLILSGVVLTSPKAEQVVRRRLGREAS